MDASVDCIDVVEDFLGVAAAHKLHGCLARESGKRFRPIPGVGHQGGIETRFDLIDDLQHLAQAALSLGRSDAILALERCLSPTPPYARPPRWSYERPPRSYAAKRIRWRNIEPDPWTISCLSQTPLIVTIQSVITSAFDLEWENAPAWRWHR